MNRVLFPAGVLLSSVLFHTRNISGCKCSIPFNSYWECFHSVRPLIYDSEAYNTARARVWNAYLHALGEAVC
jgi:hypothetical protein